ncbi:non-hydrolyzing UDP-N-acetylglucosamine 2-epimerase [Pseudomonas sp. QE6]|uniref:non-hydrolyzing UDP-N-acetylglucosamine 2-epimerase n=1 Tax=Pseudomonas sp. QE6 TaxID=3242491 RepID=UPI0035290C36
MKILTILGARPQFIKAGSVSREIIKQASSGANIEEIIVHTGQHYDANMSEIFFSEMKIPKPAYHLGIGGNTHGAMTGRMIEGVEKILREETPDWVMVYGDTNSTLAGAVAASKLKIKIAHIEAGLRSYNMNMPEEINRILTDRISSKLFCPTRVAYENLQKEGIDSWCSGAEASISGDVMLDGAIFYRNLSCRPAEVKLSGEYVLCTLHRAENTDDLERLKSIISALKSISSKIQIVLPLHPRTKKIIATAGIDTTGLTLIEPLGYLNMIWLIDNCHVVMTDSGGLQKEAYFFNKPCITLRDETEWVETVETGWNRLVGASTENIENAFFDFSRALPPQKADLYGKGEASQYIVNEMLRNH